MPRVSPALLRAIQLMYIHGAEAHWSLVPPALARRLQPTASWIGDAFATSLSGSESLRSNRVLGLGHRGRARAEDVDRIVEHYRRLRVKQFSLTLGPVPQARRITGWLLRRGFTMKRGLSLLLRDARQPVPAEPRPFEVRRAKPADRGEMVRLQERCFGTPVSRRPWSLASAASPEFQHYVALVGSTIAGVGALRVEKRLAWLGAGATSVHFRRRGVHRALIAARLARARRAGCRWVWVETTAPSRGRPDGSRRNLMRMGFEPIALEPMFVWRRR